MMPNVGRAGPAPNEIVLLEEADLYCYHSDGGLVTNHLQDPTAMAPPPPADPTKFARSVRSYRSAHTANNYARHGTPSVKRTASIDTIPAHYGALRPGGPVALFTRQYVGLLINWIIVGIFNGAISGLVTPLFSNYLGLNNTQRIATLALFDFGWYFKFLFGFITDCYPIRRQRRKPYIFIGWTVFTCFMVAMAAMDKVQWYGTDDDVRNPDAPTQGRRYIVPILVSSFAHLMANVACEGLMVEFAHREGEYDRGHAQLWCVVFRFVGETGGGAFAGFGLSSVEYGGEFAHSVPLGAYFATLALLASLGNFVTYFLLHEDTLTGTAPSFGANVRRFWRFIEQRVTLLVMIAVFLLSLAINISVQEYSEIYDVWLQTSSLAQSVVSIAASVGTLLAALGLYKWGLNTNWHALAVGGFAVALAITLPIELLTVWDVVRSSTLLLSKDWVAGIFEGIVWLVRLMVIVEVSEPGLESTTYGFLTTVCNLSNMVLTASYNVVAATWDPASTDMAADTSRVRWHLTYEFLFKYGVRFALTFAGCWLLPRQKRQLKDIKVRGAPNLFLPVVAFLVVAALFVASITSVFLTMFESTMCLKFAGGTGCDKDHTQ